MFLLVLSVA